MLLNVRDHFVDRKSELALFRRILAGREPDKQILCITMPPGEGKTWFIQRLHYECEQQAAPVALLDFHQERSGLLGDVFSLVREIHRCLGDERMPAIRAWEDTFSLGILPANAIREESGVDFGESNAFTGARINNVAGRDVYRIGAIFAGPPTAEQLARQKDDLGRALCSDLASLGRAVLLVDTFERAPEETRKWLFHWLFQSLRPQLPHLVLAVAGRPECRLFFDQSPLWSHLIVHIEHFDPFSPDDVLAYYRRRRLSVPATETVHLKAACRQVALMAQLGDAIAAMGRGGIG